MCAPINASPSGACSEIKFLFRQLKIDKMKTKIKRKIPNLESVCVVSVLLCALKPIFNSFSFISSVISGLQLNSSNSMKNCNADTKKGDSSKKQRAIVIIIPLLLGFLLVAFLGLFILKKKRKQGKTIPFPLHMNIPLSLFSLYCKPLFLLMI